jgi:hypothetical protein
MIGKVIGVRIAVILFCFLFKNYEEVLDGKGGRGGSAC